MTTTTATLTGNAAIARGFYEAGGRIATAYPGSPTVEVIEEAAKFAEIYAEFSTNEKVALEVGIGGSFAGARSMVVMKHVGVNIAADPLMTFTQTPTHGGFLLVTGDDPGLASSQNEQDNRFFGKFANMGIVDPADSAEAKEFTRAALEMSEKFQLPMMMRITSRLCHSRSVVALESRSEVPAKGLYSDRNRYCMIPPASRHAQALMRERLVKLEEYAYDCALNTLEETDSRDTLIITSGLVYNNLQELKPHATIWKLGLIYPLSKQRALEITAQYKKVIVIEEMMPFIENELKLMGIACVGKEYFSYTGELNTETIAAGLNRAKIAVSLQHPGNVVSSDVVARPPLFCSGCPHRPIFDILKQSKVKIVVGDIGCYSLAFLPPFEQSNSIISMGASLGIIKGMRKALTQENSPEPLVSVIGDGTFFHSGIPGFINLLHQQHDGENMTIIVLDNRTTAMTGGQPNAGSGSFDQNNTMCVSIKGLLMAAGLERVKEIDQFDYKTAQTVIKEEIAYQGLSVIIATGPCALRYKIEKPHYFVRPEICIGCRRCVKTNCPPLAMKKYEGIEKLKSSIDPDACVGCSICAQVCPVHAIRNSAKEEV